MSEKMRAVLHIDMNAFYCACHAAHEPAKYKGRATAVAGSPETRHGILVTASYEARRLGIRATMTVHEALRIKPNLILIQPDFTLYRSFSRQVFEIVRSFTPQVEVFSIDECWADVTGSGQFGTPMEIARKLQERILNELGLPCSIGVSENKFLAKMASDMKKPLGLTELLRDDLQNKLWPLPLRQMFGVGDKSAMRLENLHIRTIGELAAADVGMLTRYFGRRGTDWSALANGIDHSPVSAEPEPTKSVGHSITTGRDLNDFESLCTVLLNLSDQVGRRVRRHALQGKTVQITIRYANRETITRAKTLEDPTNLTEVIYKTSVELLRTHWRQGDKVRLLGVTISQLQEPGRETTKDMSGVQMSLFGDEVLPRVDNSPTKGMDLQKLKRLSNVTDALRDKYGEDIVIRGRMMTDPESGQIRNRRTRGTSLQKDNIESDKHSFTKRSPEE